MLAFITIAFNGCFLFRSAPRPELVGEELSGAERSKLFQQLTNRSEQLVTFRGLTRTTVEHDNERSTFRHAVAIGTQDRMRVDVLPVSNAYPIGIFVSAAGSALWLNNVEKEAVRAKSGGDLLADTFGVPVTESELRAYVTGVVPVSMFDSSSDVRVYGGPDQYQIIVGPYRYYFLIDRKTLDLLTVQRRNSSGRRIDLQVSCERYKEREGVRLPGKLIFSVPRYDVSATLVFTGQKINQAIQDSLFSISVPPDFSVKES